MVSPSVSPRYLQQHALLRSTLVCAPTCREGGVRLGRLAGRPAQVTNRVCDDAGGLSLTLPHSPKQAPACLQEAQLTCLSSCLRSPDSTPPLPPHTAPPPPPLPLGHTRPTTKAPAFPNQSHAPKTTAQGRNSWTET